MRASLGRWRALGAACGAGLAHALAMSAAGLWWLQIISLTGLCLVLIESHWIVSAASCRSRVSRASLLGFVFGMAWFLVGLAWLFISMHRYGAMPAPLAGLALALFCAYLALFPAVACAMGALANAKRPLAFAAMFAGTWTLTELLRGWLFTGFPWLSPGYAHSDGPLSGLAPWIGVYGIGGVAVMLASLLAHVWLERRGGLARNLSALGLALGTLLVALSAGGVQWGTTADKPLSVDLIQGNIAQELKFDAGKTLLAMQSYLAAMQPGRAQLIVLPETAWTILWSQTPPEFVAQLRKTLGDGAVAAVGMPLLASHAPSRLTNSMAVIDNRGEIVARYDKRHLVPFGEFIPPGFGWFVALMKIPLGEFHRGTPDQPMLTISGSVIGFNICYEDLFGNELATQVRNGANILINASNIAWFGDSHAPAQHLQISRMRALELARPMLRATNTGVTAAIDHRGTVLAQLPGFSERVLSVSVTPVDGLTPYARFGDLPAWLLGLTLIFTAWLQRERG